MPEPLTVVDVGARWGIADRWAALGPDRWIVGFDPDEEECARLNTALESGDDAGRVTYIPLALGATPGAATLHVTVQPACSSVYPPIGALAEQFGELECIEPTGTVEIEMVTLDDWCADHGVSVVDVMKIDTQGSELDVLRGSVRTLSTVQLLEVEVEFNPIYDGQPLFGHVDEFLRAQGFRLWRLDHLTHYAGGEWGDVEVDAVQCFDSVPHHARRPGGQLYWGHAYFVRAELCPASAVGPTTEQRRRAAIVAEVAGLGDLASWLRSA